MTLNFRNTQYCNFVNFSIQVPATQKQTIHVVRQEKSAEFEAKQNDETVEEKQEERAVTGAEKQHHAEKGAEHAVLQQDRAVVHDDKSRPTTIEQLHASTESEYIVEHGTHRQPVETQHGVAERNETAGAKPAGEVVHATQRQHPQHTFFTYANGGPSQPSTEFGHTYRQSSSGFRPSLFGMPMPGMQPSTAFGSANPQPTTEFPGFTTSSFGLTAANSSHSPHSQSGFPGFETTQQPLFETSNGMPTSSGFVPSRFQQEFPWASPPLFVGNESTATAQPDTAQSAGGQSGTAQSAGAESTAPFANLHNDVGEPDRAPADPVDRDEGNCTHCNRRKHLISVHEYILNF